MKPLNPHAHSEVVAEELCRYYRSHSGVAVTIVRPFNVQGPGQKGPFLIPTSNRQALDPSCEQIAVAGPREAVRQMKSGIEAGSR